MVYVAPQACIDGYNAGFLLVKMVTSNGRGCM